MSRTLVSDVWARYGGTHDPRAQQQYASLPVWDARNVMQPTVDNAALSNMISAAVAQGVAQGVAHGLSLTEGRSPTEGRSLTEGLSLGEGRSLTEGRKLVALQDASGGTSGGTSGGWCGGGDATLVMAIVITGFVLLCCILSALCNIRRAVERASDNMMWMNMIRHMPYMAGPPMMGASMMGHVPSATPYMPPASPYMPPATPYSASPYAPSAPYR